MFYEYFLILLNSFDEKYAIIIFVIQLFIKKKTFVDCAYILCS